MSGSNWRDAIPSALRRAVISLSLIGAGIALTVYLVINGARPPVDPLSLSSWRAWYFEDHRSATSLIVSSMLGVFGVIGTVFQIFFSEQAREAEKRTVNAINSSTSKINENILLDGTKTWDEISEIKLILSKRNGIYAQFEAMSQSPLYEDCKRLLLYMYINDSDAYEHSNGYEHKCLRIRKNGQYFGFEYTPYAIEATKDESSPKRNKDNYRRDRLKWLSVTELLLQNGIFLSRLRDDSPRARDDRRVFSLSPAGRVIAAETIKWLDEHRPDQVPQKSPFA